MVYVPEKKQLSLIRGKNAADSRGIFNVAISLEGCINRPNKGWMNRIQLTYLVMSTLEIGVPADYLFPLYSL